MSGKYEIIEEMSMSDVVDGGLVLKDEEGGMYTDIEGMWPTGALGAHLLELS